MHSTRQNHESLIEEQSSDFSGFVRERQEELERHCSSLNDLTQFVNVAFRSRKEEVEKFLTEELARDVPTGILLSFLDFCLLPVLIAYRVLKLDGISKKQT